MARPPKLSDEALTAALADHPGSTAADLSKLLGVGQSTAAKRLASLEGAGAVRRTPGGRVEGVRAPDHWSALRSADPPAASPAERTTSEEPVAEPAAAETVAEGPGSEAPAGRLGRGALGALVRDYLAARPADAFGPAGLGKALGRSQGAVSNALSAMAERGEVILVDDKPRRYRIAS
jgi:DNA-binding transcriptional ArsR family regulator